MDGDVFFIYFEEKIWGLGAAEDFFDVQDWEEGDVLVNVAVPHHDTLQILFASHTVGNQQLEPGFGFVRRADLIQKTVVAVHNGSHQAVSLRKPAVVRGAILNHATRQNTAVSPNRRGMYLNVRVWRLQNCCFRVHHLVEDFSPPIGKKSCPVQGRFLLNMPEDEGTADPFCKWIKRKPYRVRNSLARQFEHLYLFETLLHF